MLSFGLSLWMAGALVAAPSRYDHSPLDNHGGPDLFGYTFTDNIAPDTASFEWIELCGDPNSLNGPTGDDGSALVTWGWDFPFYDGSYSSVYVSTNGLLQFEETVPPSSWANACPFATLNPTYPRIAVYWDDLYGAVSGGCNNDGLGPWVRWRDFGEYAVIEWCQIPHFNTPDRLTFEAILYPNGSIKFQYLNISVPAHPNGASIGIDAPGEGYGVDYLTCNSTTFPDGTTNRAVWFTRLPGIPNSVTDLAAVTEGDNVILTWVDPTTDSYGAPIIVDSIEIWLGLPDSGARIATVLDGLQSFTHVNAPYGHPTYFVRPFNDGHFDIAPSASVTITVGSPTYNENFDFTDGLWVTQQEGGWEWGAPTYYAGPDAHSGSQLWGTVLDDSYPGGNAHEDGACLILDLVLEREITSSAATVEFWMWHISESNYDGCNFQISTDGGINWQIIRPIQSDYTREFVWENRCLGDSSPCWEGISDGWVHTVLPIGRFFGEVPIFRFQFGADSWEDTPNAGYYFDDLEIWGLEQPVVAEVTGNVMFDGGVGIAAQSVVTCTGHGLHTVPVHPTESGSYTMDDVYIGERTITAFLEGYHAGSANIVLTGEGASGVNITLRRLDPAPPMNLEATINNSNDPITLEWTNSTDPLVDEYRVYRKLSTETIWALSTIAAGSPATDQPPAPGTYDYKVTAVDHDVTPPSVESRASNIITVLYSSPASLHANGNFDDHVRLYWLSPGQHDPFPIAYDDGTAEMFLSVHIPNAFQDHFAVRFTPPSMGSMPYPLTIQSCNLYVESTEPLRTLLICSDQDGIPNLSSPLMEWEGAAAIDSPGWLTAETNGTILLEDDSDFWVVWRMNWDEIGPAIGADNSAPDLRSYYTDSPPNWEQWTTHDWIARVWLSAEPDFEFELSVGEPRSGPTDHVARAILQPSSEKHTLSASDKISIAPELDWVGRERGNSLDGIQHFNVFRDGAYLAQSTATWFNDFVNEGAPHSYYVTAVYDDNGESTPSNVIQAVASMAPGVPTNVNGIPSDGTHMILTWVDPTINMDGSPCSDLTSLAIYRNHEYVGSVLAGAQQYLDRPPVANRYYEWTVRARDEALNEGNGGSFAGAIVSEWEAGDYDWIEISESGDATELGGENELAGPFEIGFGFPFYGTYYPTVKICSKGYMQFTGSSAIGTNASIPALTQPNNCVYPFWDDLIMIPSVSSVLYESQINPDRFVVSYINLAHRDNPAATRYTFQVVLDPLGGMTFNYQSIAMNAPDNSSCTVGAENVSGTIALQACYNGIGEFIPESSTAIDFWGGTSARLQGIVRSFGGAAIENVLVQPQGSSVSTLTDIAGYYSLPLNPGEYTICYTHPSYCDTCLSDIVMGNVEDVTQNMQMRAPTASISITSITVSIWSTQSDTIEFEIANPGQCPLEFTITDTSEWLSVTPEEGVVDALQSLALEARITTTDLTPNTEYQSEIAVQHNAGSPYHIAVFLTVANAAGESVEIPREYKLNDNYPNPFNATTTLSFDLPDSRRISLSLYNIAGQEVAQIIESRFPAGRHQLQFDAGSLPSGMYLLKFEAGDYQEVNKILLLK